MEQMYKDLTKKYQVIIEDYLENYCFQYEEEPQKKLFEAMRYSLLAGGKRLRPLLVMEFCRISGGDVVKAVPFAAAVEMIHTYSLIHDDLPCMDNDDFRRGRPTNHKVYGEATAVLAGDALLTAAFGFIASADLSAEARIQAVATLSECAGELGMVGGQVLDMEGESKECSFDDIIAIHTKKTAALIIAACSMGVLAAGGSKEKMEAAIQYGSFLGLAFQVRDDMLDQIGDSQKLGKSVGTDGNKNTFVNLCGLEQCDEMVKMQTQFALQALDCFEDTDYLKWYTQSLINRFV